MIVLLFLALWHPSIWIAHAANVAATVADIETTQRCLAVHTCKEGNPVMPDSRAGAYSVGLGLDSIEAIAAHEMHKHHDKCWWIAPFASTIVHSGAAISNAIRFK